MLIKLPELSRAMQANPVGRLIVLRMGERLKSYYKGNCRGELVTLYLTIVGSTPAS